MLSIRRDELNRWARTAFLVLFPFLTTYKIIHHYLLWLHGATPADRANHGFRAAAWVIMGVIIFVSLASRFNKRTGGKTT
jgi:hypothetical protein